MESTWKTPQLGRKPRGGYRPGGAPAPPQPLPAPAGGPWASVDRRSRSRVSSKALHRLHQHHTRSSDPRRDPPPQPPISKMDSCHISEERGPWHRVPSITGPGAGDGGAGSLPRLPRHSKCKGRGLSVVLGEGPAKDTDGEQSDPDARGGRKLRLTQLQPGCVLAS